MVSSAETCRQRGGFNQCPTASGIGDSSNNGRSNIDLVRWCEADRHARLVELKWDNKSPVEAVQQILRYAAAYVFCRVHSTWLPLPVPSRPIMDARHVSILVAAPALYCREPMQGTEHSSTDLFYGRMDSRSERGM